MDDGTTLGCALKEKYMSTKVFISWSGVLSRKLATALRNWLPSTLQFVKPYFSPEDIEKGTKWGSEISKELETSNIGIICLTRDNTEKPWILFEAGALSKSLEKSRVCTLLFDIDPSEVKGPLTSFQATRFLREDFKRLVAVINNAAGDARLEAPILDSVFEMWWPKLEAEVIAIIKAGDTDTKKELRSERDILEEVLELTRLNSVRSTRSRVPDRVLSDLISCLTELHKAPFTEDDEVLFRALERIDMPMRYLCEEAGAFDAFERYRNETREIRELLDRKLSLRATMRQKGIEEVDPEAASVDAT
jgi:hypothetical protein